MNTPIPSPQNPTGAPAVDPQRLAMTRQELVQRIEWLERLTANEDFTRFLDMAKTRLDVTAAKASDIDNLPSEKRDAYAQAHLELRYFVKWPETQLAQCNAAVRELDARQRPK